MTRDRMPMKRTSSTKSRTDEVPAVDERDRDEEKDVDGEGDEDQGVEVVDGAVADPGVADRLHAALDGLAGLVEGVAGPARGEKVDEDERPEGKGETSQAERAM
jgi:hypothetical protein